MILDSSAILAILFEERDHHALVRKLLASERNGIAAPTLVESAMVLARGSKGSMVGSLDRFLQQFELTVIPFGDAHWRAAREAFLRYGRGRHPAGLNFGDCISYATAKLADRPLLFVGDDFSKTDLRAA